MLDFAEIQIGQEDRTLVTHCGDFQLFLVADGAGGIGGGAEAADDLLTLAARYFNNQPEKLSPDLLCDFLMFADNHIYNSPQSGETTAVIVAVQGDSVFSASVGDSEAWVIESHDLCELTEGQVRKPLLGSASSVPKSLGLMKTTGKIILGSDGLFKYAKMADIASIVRTYTPKECIPRLLDLVQFPSGRYPDDVAIIVCDMN